MGVWFAEGTIGTQRQSPFWTGVVLRMAQPSRDRLTAVSLHSSGPLAENKQGNRPEYVGTSFAPDEPRFATRGGVEDSMIARNA